MLSKLIDYFKKDIEPAPLTIYIDEKIVKLNGKKINWEVNTPKDNTLFDDHCFFDVLPTCLVASIQYRRGKFQSMLLANSFYPDIKRTALIKDRPSFIPNEIPFVTDVRVRVLLYVDKTNYPIGIDQRIFLENIFYKIETNTLEEHDIIYPRPVDITEPDPNGKLHYIVKTAKENPEGDPLLRIFGWYPTIHPDEDEEPKEETIGEFRAFIDKVNGINKSRLEFSVYDFNHAIKGTPDVIKANFDNFIITDIDMLKNIFNPSEPMIGVHIREENPLVTVDKVIPRVAVDRAIFYQIYFRRDTGSGKTSVINLPSKVLTGQSLVKLKQGDRVYFQNVNPDDEHDFIISQLSGIRENKFTECPICHGKNIKVVKDDKSTRCLNTECPGFISSSIIKHLDVIQYSDLTEHVLKSNFKSTTHMLDYLMSGNLNNKDDENLLHYLKSVDPSGFIKSEINIQGSLVILAAIEKEIPNLHKAINEGDIDTILKTPYSDIEDALEGTVFFDWVTENFKDNSPFIEKMTRFSQSYKKFLDLKEGK